MKRIATGLGVVLVLLAALPARATVIVTRTTIADTYANDGGDTGSRGSNYGGAGTMSVHDNGSNRCRLGYVRFDISGYAGSILGQVNVHLTRADTESTQNSASFQVWGLVDGSPADHPTTGWSETGLTYNNASARSGYTFTTSSPGTGTPQGYAALLGTFQFSGLTQGQTAVIGANPSGVTVSVDLAANMLAFLQADTNGFVTFMFRHTSGGSKVPSFYTKENTAGTGGANEAAYNPKLSFAVPEPASLAVLAPGGLAVALRRRRHPAA